jgi:hypothetical protein
MGTNRRILYAQLVSNFHVSRQNSVTQVCELLYEGNKTTGTGTLLVRCIKYFMLEWIYIAHAYGMA